MITLTLPVWLSYCFFLLGLIYVVVGVLNLSKSIYRLSIIMKMKDVLEDIVENANDPILKKSASYTIYQLGKYLENQTKK